MIRREILNYVNIMGIREIAGDRKVDDGRVRSNIAGGFIRS